MIAVLVSPFFVPTMYSYDVACPFCVLATGTIAVSILGVLIFLGAFGLFLLISALALDANPWIHDVEHMKYNYFNRYPYIAWLYENDRRKWARETVIGGLIGSIVAAITVFGIYVTNTVFVGNSWPADTIAWSSFGGTLVTLFFAFIFYEAYVANIEQPNADEGPMPTD